MSDTATPIVLTDAAVRRVAALAAAEPDTVALRVAVRPGGCSGMSYEMFFESDLASDDVVATFDVDDAEVTVAVDPTSAVLISGATLDHRDSLEQSGFHVSNPNAQRTCGCGQSFS